MPVLPSTSSPLVACSIFVQYIKYSKKSNTPLMPHLSCANPGFVIMPLSQQTLKVFETFRVSLLEKDNYHDAI